MLPLWNSASGMDGSRALRGVLECRTRCFYSVVPPALCVRRDWPRLRQLRRSPRCEALPRRLRPHPVPPTYENRWRRERVRRSSTRTPSRGRRAGRRQAAKSPTSQSAGALAGASRQGFPLARSPAGDVGTSLKVDRPRRLQVQDGSDLPWAQRDEQGGELLDSGCSINGVDDSTSQYIGISTTRYRWMEPGVPFSRLPPLGNSMKNIAVPVLVVAFAAFAAAQPNTPPTPCRLQQPAPSARSPSVHDVLSRSVAALGGEAALDKLTSASEKGTFQTSRLRLVRSGGAIREDRR